MKGPCPSNMQDPVCATYSHGVDSTGKSWRGEAKSTQLFHQTPTFLGCIDMASDDVYDYFMNAFTDDTYDDFNAFLEDGKPDSEKKKVLADNTRCNEDGYCFHFCDEGGKIHLHGVKGAHIKIEVSFRE